MIAKAKLHVIVSQHCLEQYARRVLLAKVPASHRERDEIRFQIKDAIQRSRQINTDVLSLRLYDEQRETLYVCEVNAASTEGEVDTIHCVTCFRLSRTRAIPETSESVAERRRRRLGRNKRLGFKRAKKREDY